jgi:hypothetical protein
LLHFVTIVRSYRNDDDTSNSSNNQVWADVIEGTEGPEVIVGTLGDDQIDSKGGNDFNLGDTVFGESSGNDNIISGGWR